MFCISRRSQSMSCEISTSAKLKIKVLLKSITFWMEMELYSISCFVEESAVVISFSVANRLEMIR